MTGGPETMSALDEYWNRIDLAMSDRVAHAVQLDRISEEILSDRSVARSADALFAAAYCKYMHPARVDSPARQTDFHAAAQRVFEQRADHAHMWLFVGFCRFDARELPAAAVAFDEANEDELEDDDRVKKAELRLCCAVDGVDLDSAVPLVEAFVERYRHEDELDVFPVHLLSWVERACGENQPSLEGRRRLNDAVRLLLSSIHQEGTFADVLAVLDGWTAGS